MAADTYDPTAMVAPTLEQISKVWNSLPIGLNYATANELQELNEVCCFNMEQVNKLITVFKCISTHFPSKNLPLKIM